MTRSIWHARGVDRLKADICVVGAGIIGASTAWWLGRLNPEMDVLLLDAQFPAYGASGRNAGFLLQGAATDYATDHQIYGRDRALRLREYTQQNRDLLLAELDPLEFGFTASGSIMVAGDPGEEQRLMESAQMLQADGYPGEYLSAAVVNARLGSRHYLGALFVASGGMLDPVRLVGQLVAGSGARVRHQSAAVRLEPGAVVGNGFRVESNQVVLALGPWLPDVVPSAAAWVRPVRAQMTAFKPSLPMTLGMPVYSHEGYYYLRPHPDGSVLVGGARHLHRDEEVGFEDLVTDRLQSDLRTYATRHFAELEGAQRIHSWSGVMGFSPDGLPVVDTVAPGVWAATGFTGHGMAYGFRTGRLLASLATGVADPFADLFQASRLG